jgi:biotin carboxyl carrier protein
MDETIEYVGLMEATDIQERVVISPCCGRFKPMPPETFATEGEWVRRGQLLAHINTGTASVPVESLFEGWVMGMLAVPGQPVSERDPLFWIRP